MTSYTIISSPSADLEKQVSELKKAVKEGTSPANSVSPEVGIVSGTQTLATGYEGLGPRLRYIVLTVHSLQT